MASPAPDRPSSTQLQHELDAVVATGATGASARVEHGARHQVLASSGVAERGFTRPVPAEGKFRVGSVTKTFIAAAILQLVADHRLDLDDTIDRRLPGFIPDDSGITVRELLNHTSGLMDVLATFPQPGTPEFVDLRWQTWAPRDLVARVAERPLLFPPGTKADYSNTNYMVLALMAFNPTIMWGGGEMISTSHDLNRFFDELLGGRWLPPHLMREVHTTALDSKYGLGIIKRKLSCGSTAWGKDGDAPGYSTWSFRAPDSGKRVTVSATLGTGDPGDAVDSLLDAELCP